MIFKYGRTYDAIKKEREAKYCHWHDYFVWFPMQIAVSIEDGSIIWVWLHTVERCGSRCWNQWKNMPEWFDYRLKKEDSHEVE